MTILSYDRLVDLVSTLTYPELKALQAVVNSLIEAGYLPAQGHVEYRFITRHGKPYGPYKYRRLWQKGKLIARYEGKATLEEYHAWLAQKATPPPASHQDGSLTAGDEQKGRETRHDESFEPATTDA